MKAERTRWTFRRKCKRGGWIINHRGIYVEYLILETAEEELMFKRMCRECSQADRQLRQKFLSKYYTVCGGGCE